MNDSVTSLLLEQRRRWLQGESVLVEHYLKQWPELRQNPEGILDLIYNEIVLRESHGDKPGLEEYLQRFPEFAEPLELQFRIHRAIEDERLDIGSSSWTGSSADPPLDSKLILPGYEVLGEIGRGGMGVVYRARQLSLKRLVAVKVIRAGAHATQEEEAHFRTEAQAVARLQHPNIVQIHEIGEHEGLLFLTLELVRGSRLDTVAAGQPVPADDAALLVETLARAMHYVHQQGIVHRDLKPGNVLLASVPGSMSDDRSQSGNFASLDPANWIPKITDFGLAKLMNDDLANSATKMMIGTPNYMAPEQASAKGTPIGPATDVYALGAILYELLTGRPPFHGHTVFDVLEQVRRQDPVRPTRLRPTVPRDLETICLKCLQKGPGRRYASAFDLAEDLHRFCAHEPIRARSVGHWERAQKWARRRPAVAGLLAVTAAAVAMFALSNLRHKVELQASAARTRVDERQEQFVRLQQARTMYETFVQRRAEALFHGLCGTLFHTKEEPASLAATYTASQQALAIVGLNPASDSVPQLNPYWSDREKAEVIAGCYQLFLVQADATAYLPQQSPDARHQQLRQSIEIVDRAAKLFAPTHSFHLRRGRYLLQLGDEAGARHELALAAQMQPTSLIDYLLLGDEQYQHGDVQMAVQSFHKALLLEPGDFWSQFLLAVCQLKLHRPGEAEVGLTKCLGQRPEFPWVHLFRGLAFAELNAFDASEKDFETALRLTPNGDVQYVVLVSRGLQRFRQKQFGEAIIDLQKAIASKPEQLHARISLARLYQVQMDFDKSNEQFEQILLRKPSAPVAAECYVERSRNLWAAKRYQEALEAADTALMIAPDYVEGYQRRAVALLELKRFREALQSFDQYRAKGDNVGSEFYRKRGRAKMQLQDYLGAKDDYTRALELGSDTDLLTHRGWAYFFSEAWKLALHDFEEAIRLNRDNGDAYVGRGLARVMLGQCRDAVADAEEALRRQPRTPEMMHNIACIFSLTVAYAEKSSPNEDLQGLAPEYRKRALQLVRKTIAMVRPEDRSIFWRNKIHPDPALDSVRNSQGFKDLQTEHLRMTDEEQ